MARGHHSLGAEERSRIVEEGGALQALTAGNPADHLAPHNSTLPQLGDVSLPGGTSSIQQKDLSWNEISRYLKPYLDFLK